jgi:pilus assembly protein CpaE
MESRLLMSSIQDLRIAAVAPTDTALQSLVGQIAAVKGLSVEVSLKAEGQALDSLLDLDAIDLLFVCSDLNDERALSAMEQVTARFADLDVILVCEQPTAQTLRQALRVGVREVIAPAESTEELTRIVERLASRRKPTRAYQARVLAFVSCKGGSGATFIATNLGYCLAEQTGKRVILIDLNLQFGDAILYLSDRRPASSVLEVVRDVQRMDAALLQSSVVQVLPNYWVLPAPGDPAMSAELSADRVAQLIRFARTQADYVILDLGRNLDAPTVQALDEADLVYPVLQQTLPYIRDGKRMLDVFRSLGYPQDKVRPLLSRFTRGADISIDDLQEALGLPMFASIPNEYAVASASVNQGEPVLKLSRTSAISRSLLEFVGRMERPVVESQAPWFKRLLRRT